MIGGNAATETGSQSRRASIRRALAQSKTAILHALTHGLAVSLLISTQQWARASEGQLRPEHDRQVWVSQQLLSPRTVNAIASKPYADISVSAFGVRQSLVSTARGTVPFNVYYVAPNFFQTIGASALLGTIQSNATPTVVMTKAAWVRHFDADPRVLTEPITVDGRPSDISGIASVDALSVDPFEASALFLPLSAVPDIDTVSGSDIETMKWLTLIVRGPRAQLQTEVRSFVSLADASSALEFISLDEHLRSSAPAKRIALTIQVLSYVAISLALLVVSAAASDATGQIERRKPAYAIRIAMGASRGHLALELMAHTLPRIAVASVSAAIITPWTQQALLSFFPSASAATNHVADVEIVSTMGLAFVTSAVFSALSTIPAVLRLIKQVPTITAVAFSRHAAADSAGASAGRLLMSAVQVGTTFLLVSAAVLAVNTLYRQMSRPLGFERGRVLVVRPFLPRHHLAASSGEPMVEYLIRRLRESMTIEQAAIATAAPFGDELFVNDVVLPDGASFRSAVNTVGPQYLRTIGARLLAGNWDVDFARNGDPGVVVNLSLIQALGIRLSDAVGSTMSLRNAPERMIITGVVENGIYETLAEAQWPTVFLPSSGRWDPSSSIVLRVNEPRSAGLAARYLVSKLLPDGVAVDIYALDERVEVLLYRSSQIARAAIAVAAVSLLCAAMSIGTVLTDLLRRRRASIAIRQMLGASPSRSVLVAGRELIPAVLGGVGLGVAGTLAAAPSFEPFFEGADISPGVLISVVLLFMALVLLVTALFVGAKYLRNQPSSLLRSSQIGNGD